MKDDELPFDHKSHVLYSKPCKKEILAKIALHYPEAEREAVWEQVQLRYAELLSDWRTDLGGKKNFHNGVGGTYDCIAIMSYYVVCKAVTSFREIEEIEENLILPTFRKMKFVDCNKPFWRKLMYKAFVRAKSGCDKWHDYEMTVAPYENGKPIYYEFTSCPAAEFAIRHGLTDIMPALCNVDYASMELLHARLIRTTTCVKAEAIEMLFQTYGDRRNPAVLFFHAMGVTGASSEPIARYLQDRYFCILPTSTVYCEGQKYVSKQDEIRQVEDFLHRQGVERLAMVVASSIGADLAMAFLTQTKLPVEHAFFDGGQFAQIGKGTRRIMTPFLYFAIKSLYWSKGGTLKKILWCDDDSIKSYFIDAGKNLTYTNLRRQILDSLEDKPFPALSEELQKHLYFEFGSIEDHFKYRQAVIEAYPCGNYPVFEGYDHMQYQIRDPKGFAEMLAFIAEQDGMPKLPFIRK